VDGYCKCSILHLSQNCNFKHAMHALFFFSTIEVSEIFSPDFPFEFAVCYRVSCVRDVDVNIRVIYVLLHRIKAIEVVF